MDGTLFRIMVITPFRSSGSVTTHPHPVCFTPDGLQPGLGSWVRAGGLSSSFVIHAPGPGSNSLYRNLDLVPADCCANLNWPVYAKHLADNDGLHKSLGKMAPVVEDIPCMEAAGFATCRNVQIHRHVHVPRSGNARTHIHTSYTYIHTYLPTYIHTYIHTYLYIHKYVIHTQTYIHT